MLRRCLILALLAIPAALPAQSAIPTPESVFGFEPGAEKKLANYEKVVEYYRKVDAASDRVRMFEAGKSFQGRTFAFALVSSKANLDRLDRYREIARRLAHPDGLSESDARALAREGKAFVHIDGGLHSSEVAGPQHTPLLLHELLRRASEPEIAAILDNVILMLWPTINPDGHSMVADHYMARVGTPNESQAMSLPVLYQEYVGHDNNRDAYMLNTVESRVMEHAWREWEPSIIYVHHQSSPFPTRIWLPPFAEPIAQHAPYIVSRQLNMIGMAIAQRLELEGKPGATHMGTGFDAWYPGYIDYNPVFKNIPAFWTETQGTGPATTTSPLERIPADMRRPQALYASPWLGGTWRMRDAVEYMTTASIATLDYAAKFKEALLFGRYQAGRDQIQQGRTSAPYAYIVPQEQRDPAAAVEMLRRLAFSGLRVYQLTAPAEITVSTQPDMQVAVSHPAGTWIVPADQEFAALAREVLDVQKYPEIRETPGGPLELPYDAAGWTMPLSMGVQTFTASSPLGPEVRRKMRLLGSLPSPTAKPALYNMDAKAEDAAPFDSAPGIGFDANPVAKAIVPPDGRVSGAGPALAVTPAETNAFRALNRAWKLGASVRYDPAGRYVITGYPAFAVDDLAKSFALRVERVAMPVGPDRVRPRIGLFLAATSMDEGWTRWVLDAYQFEYARVSGADIEAGSLRNKIDVLIISDEAGGVTAGGRGGRGGGAAPAGGGAGAAPPQAGPNNEARIKALDEFVRGGGTVVALNRSAMAVVDQLKLPVRNVVAGVNRQQFFAGTSLLWINVAPGSQVTAGSPAKAAVFYSGSPVFETLDGFKGTVLARYPENENPLASGFLQGEKLIQGKAAALDIPVGDGRVILLGFRPQWRGQPFGSFRMLFNAAVLGTVK
jgi:hypothetical protein